ncbi:hypothetical protein TDB9533_01332 [Thalassocella blandensis]|nr:hypothetical protein TDB9533_01332 [Thalassocella blandensis]
MRERVGLITDIDFWKGGAGSRVRSRSLVRYLTKYFDIAVFYSNKAKPSDIALLKRLKLPLTYYNLNDLSDNLEIDFQSIFNDLSIRQCIIRGWQNIDIGDYLPSDIRTFLISMISVVKLKNPH